MDKPLLSPLNDYVLKRLLAEHPELLRDILQAVRPLPEEEYAHLVVVDPTFRAHKAHDKLPILDIKLLTTSGIQIDIEAQRQWHKYFDDRLVYYTARMYVDKLHSGDLYKELKLAISIVIAEFVLEPRDKIFHHKYSLYDPEARISFRKRAIELHTLEIPKRRLDDMSPLGLWMHFFAARTEEDFMSLAQASPVMQKAWTVIKELSADEEARLLAETQEKMRRDMDAFYETGFDKGKAEGWTEGKAEGWTEGKDEGIRSVAANMLENGVSLDLVCRYTGLSVDEVRKLPLQ